MSAVDIPSLDLEGLTSREWLLSLGNGGYSSSTLCNCNTRKYHGLLVAALSPPVQRVVILSRVDETVRGVGGGESWELAANEYPGVMSPGGHQWLRAFSHEPFPRWAYQTDSWTIEKHLRPLPGRNLVILTYTLLGGRDEIELELRPLFALRGIHELMQQWHAPIEAQEMPQAGANGGKQLRIPATSRTTEAFFLHYGEFSPQGCWYLNNFYRREQERGYAPLEDLWMPGVIRRRLAPGQSAHFLCSTEPIDAAAALAEAAKVHIVQVPARLVTRQDHTLQALLRAARHYTVTGAVAGQDQHPAVVGGYPFAPVAGRDAMICLPGLYLVTGRLEEARDLLRVFARLLDHGVMPSSLTENGLLWRYYAGDTALWFIQAVWEYLRYGGDEAFVTNELLGVVEQIIDATLGGSALGIWVDAQGLFHCSSKARPMSWMDAGIGPEMVTPRNGRPVCMNALWYNALRIAAELLVREGSAAKAARARELQSQASQTRQAFGKMFWNEQENCLFDVLGDDAPDGSVRPNQLLAVTLAFPVVEEQQQRAIVEKVMSILLTPVGLRTLAANDPKYRGTYGGPISQRDAAHHQGSAFPWLLGGLLSAYLRLFGRGPAERARARGFLQGCVQHLTGSGQGHICELFDGDAPHRPGGNIASARSVAEVLRAYVEDILDIPAPGPREKPMETQATPVVPAVVA